MITADQRAELIIRREMLRAYTPGHVPGSGHAGDHDCSCDPRWPSVAPADCPVHGVAALAAELRAREGSL